MQIKEAHIIKVGNSYYFTIPKALINAEIIDLKAKYNLKLKKVNET